MPSTDASSPSLAQHIKALYPLARVLVGSDEAGPLVRQVYEHAAAVPPPDWPPDERAWLFQLMLDAQDGSLHPAGAEVTPNAETSFTDDPFRREVAEQMAEKKLPVAFAACSVHERFILAIDALANPTDEILAVALDTSTTNARSIRDRARSSLRASLRDVLNGPERMLVDVALPDDALRTHLHRLLSDRFHPVPPALQSDVVALLEDADAADAGPFPNWLPETIAAVLPSRPSLRSLMSAVLVMLVLGAGVGGAIYVFSPSSPPGTTNLITLSIQRAPTLEVAHPAQSPDDAAEYVRRVWNRQVSVPSITDASLQGISEASWADQSVPVFLYTDTRTNQRMTVYAFNYALLDRMDSLAVLKRKVRTQLASASAPLFRRQSGQGVAVWRQRDDIFVLIAPGLNADTLRSRLQL
jgi:hypothetical protein